MKAFKIKHYVLLVILASVTYAVMKHFHTAVWNLKKIYISLKKNAGNDMFIINL